MNTVQETPYYQHEWKPVFKPSNNIQLGVGVGIILQLEYMGMRRMDGLMPMMRVSRAAESPVRSLG